jgi:hypothetical protein
MAVNWSTMVYDICQNVFGRPVTFNSTLGNSFTGTNRGMYSSQEQSVIIEDGSILTDQKTILDIRSIEYGTLPVQGDTVSIPEDPVSLTEAAGDFEILDVSHNGGGEVTLELRKIVS